ncbi:MAG: hypothetical protein Q4C87_02055 [Actinomycetaceae bacterium]|nr:hypothetical protein [Actinomycetaceae bacterium]
MDIGQPLPVQVNQQTCGIASLALAKARVGLEKDYLKGNPALVAATQLRLHAQAAWTGIPWPKALGTAPWALAVLARQATGMKYRIRPWTQATAAAAQEALDAGHDVFLYSGGAGQWWNRFIPRHVILGLGQNDTHEAGALTIYEPSTGQVHKAPLSAIAQSDPTIWPALGHWRHIIFAVIPRLDNAAPPSSK